MSSLLEACKANFKSYEQSGWDRVFIYKQLPDVARVLPESAAVLIPIFVKNNKLHVLLTRRSHNVRLHKGHISFPGGKREQQDSNYTATALREATEEVGISSQDVEVVSTTWQQHFIGNLPVYPVIGVLRPGFKVFADSDEVSEVFDVPLEFFLEEETHRELQMKYNGRTYFVHNFEYYSELTQTKYFIWGLTGSLCLKAAIIALKNLPSFELKSKNQQRAFEGFVLNKQPIKVQLDCSKI